MFVQREIVSNCTVLLKKKMNENSMSNKSICCVCVELANSRLVSAVVSLIECQVFGILHICLGKLNFK